MKKIAMLLVAASMISGCDVMDDIHEHVKKMTKSPVVEIPSGYKVMIDNQEVPIYGTDFCVSDDSRRDCIVIGPYTEVVEVIVGFPNRPLREAWTIKRIGEQVGLTRGDGTRIYAEN
ncbi:hypothetical protein ACTG16_21760 [Aeromonas sp. 23P]|uniref:hypothetical protein n=1 Tax=Aeromonas sp. 23P TaxID=3452716 RepID=UPI003F79C71E